MDWGAVVELHRESLKRILASLIAMAGLAEGVDVPTLPRRLYRAVLRLLRPAEAATRRLIIIAARGLVVTLPPPRPKKSRPKSIFVRDGHGTGIVLPHGVRPSDVMPGLAEPRRSLSFPLLDPLRFPRKFRPVTRSVPRISVPGVTVPFPVAVRRPPSAEDPIDATRLRSRLRLLANVLNDLPRQARQFARWQARNYAGLTRRLWPLRPGKPPGSRRKADHAADDVLVATHGLAFDALARRDTS